MVFFLFRGRQYDYIIGKFVRFWRSFSCRDFKFFKRGQEQKHGQKMQLQMEIGLKKSELKIEELDKEAEIKETEGLYKHDSTDAGGFINAIRGSVSHVIHYCFLRTLSSK